MFMNDFNVTDKYPRFYVLPNMLESAWQTDSERVDAQNWWNSLQVNANMYQALFIPNQIQASQVRA